VLRSRTRALSDLLSDEYLLRLHKEMFGDVWKWAGKFRERDTNIGVPSHLIRTSLRQLYAEVRGWLEYRAYAPDEIAIRLKYRVVTIIPFRMAMAGMGACSHTSPWFDILDWSRCPGAER
jgi:fido (protein-threonine AMPylation protein)